MIPNPQRFIFSLKEKILLYIMAAIGLVTFVVSFQCDPQRTWVAYLHQYFYWFAICLAGVFFSALQYLAGSKWSVTVRRIAESFIGFLPVAIILFVILLSAIHNLFEWSHVEVVAKDAILQSKQAYLNQPFFIIRGVALFIVVIVFGGTIIKNSIKQDETGDVELTRKNNRLSAPFILLFGWLFTFVSIDLLMSLAPHWFSTMFGVYAWAGLFYSGVAMITLWAIVLKRRGPLDAFFTQDHLHDLGKLMLAFVIFWAYVGFSQFMLIWYANMPEETFYFNDRFQGSWQNISIALYVIKFGIPFFLLLGRWAKRWENYMMFLCFWFLAAQWLDVYWVIYPSFYKTPVFGWQEIGLFVGFAGLFFLSVGQFLSKVNPVAIKDPLLESSLHHHQ